MEASEKEKEDRRRNEHVAVKESGVYEIVNIANGKRYIGSSVVMRKRFRTHRQRARIGNHHSAAFQRAWNKYGEAGFIFRPVLLCAPENLLLYEQLAFDALRPEYNASKVAGSRLGTRHTEMARAKMSEAQRGKSRAPFSLAHREAIAAARALRVTKPETRLKLSLAHKGRVFTPEHKARIAAALTGRTYSAERVAAMVASRWKR